MKPTPKIFLALGLVALMAACSPALKVTSDYDQNVNFSQYKTFNFYNLKTSGSVSQLNAERIANAIRAELSAKGLKEVNSNPDLMVNAVTLVKEKQQVNATTNYYGYGGLYRPYGYWGGMGMGSGYTTVSTYNYKDGSLTIDIVDTKTNKMVWQGIGNKEIDKSPKDPDAAINEAVKAILAKFPPGK